MTTKGTSDDSDVGDNGLTDGSELNTRKRSNPLPKPFSATQAELWVLARHYLELIYAFDFEFGVFGLVGSSEMRMQPVAAERLSTIESLLGEAETSEILKSVRDRWENLFDQVDDLCKLQGLENPWELDRNHPGFERLADQAGYFRAFPSFLELVGDYSSYEGEAEGNPEVS